MINEDKQYLRDKLAHHAGRVAERYKLYASKYTDRSKGVVTTKEMRDMYKSVLGWPAKAVDAIGDRLVFRGFRNDYFEMWDIFLMNNPAMLFDSAINGALIGSCSFIYIAEPEDGEESPRMQVIDGMNATGVIDTTTGLLKLGVVVLDRDKAGEPVAEAFLEPYRTEIIYREDQGRENVVFEHKVPYPLLVPVIHRPDAVRPFGRSRITRSAEYWTEYARRTLERSDITAEFYSFPQKFITGLDPEADLDSWRASISAMLTFSVDSDGNSPKLGQFSPVPMTPFMEQLRMAASGFAGESGLTLDDLGFSTDNPSSSEAIKASHESLRISARKAQRDFGSAFINAGYVAVCLREGRALGREAFYETIPVWEPIFELDVLALGGVGDAIQKVNSVIPNYFNPENVRDITGVDSSLVRKE